MRVAVVGAGVVGLAAAYELGRRGHQVRCYEVGVPMAARSAGDTRIFRLAHAAPEFVEWAVRARLGWAEWSALAGEPLVGAEGTVVSGSVTEIADAMAAAGVAHSVRSSVGDVALAAALPARAPAGPFLVDAAGGAIRAAATGRFLLGAVGTSVVRAGVGELRAGRVVAGGQAWACDAVLIAAGAATPGLAASVGIAVPDVLEHHARFTFRLRDASAAPPCWLERSGAWRPGFTTYQHLAGPGVWAVGGQLPAETRWDLGRDAAVAASREVVCAYAAEFLPGVDPEPLDMLYCDPLAGVGDGVGTAVAGSVLAVWGNNLFKLAPYLAGVLADRLTEIA